MKMLIALLLFSGSVMAQTYDVSLTLGGVTYSGSFFYTPTLGENQGGQPVTIGQYSNVSLSDPYAGTLTSIYDPYDGNLFTQHELWFESNAGGPIGINIPNAGVTGTSVPVTGATVYTTPTSYESCAVCAASITEVVPQLHEAPELDPAGSIASITLLACGILILKRPHS